MIKALQQKLEAALAKPLPEDLATAGRDKFDPWGDVVSGIYGNYNSACDQLYIEALEAVRDSRTYEFVETHGLAGEMVLYVLAGHQLTDYGTSPLGPWPDLDIRHLWQQLIDKWKAYYAIAWPTDERSVA